MQEKQDANNILKGSPRYFEVAEGIRLGESALDFLALNLPPVCNYRCKKCSTASRSRKPGNLLTLEEIKNVLGESREMGALALAISGEGEPLASRLFLDIIQSAYDLGMVSVIATNGSLLDRDTAEFLFEHDATLTISLDTLDKGKYEQQCMVKRKFDDVLENIRAVREIYREDIAKKDSLKVYRAGIHTTVNSGNLEELMLLKEYCGDDLFFSAAYIADKGNAAKNPHMLTDYERIKRAAEEQGEAFLLCQSRKGLPVCGFFYYGLTVGCNGEVLLADHAIDSEGLIGNIRDSSLETLRIKASDMIEDFYGRMGSCYCIVRDPNYKEFIAGCKNEK